MSLLPELLCPAGDPVRLAAVLRYGADAVYLGGPGHSLRPASLGFDLPALAGAVRLAASQGAKIYYCLNAIAREEDIGEVADTLRALADLPCEARPAALIVADPGVMRLARRHAPDFPVHVSTQANTANSEAVRFWADQGATRVNLARELALGQMRRIMRAAPDMEYEAFVHGAQCLAVSGQCQLSASLLGRAANRGECAHPCRYKYRAVGLALEEETRPGEALWEVLAEDDGYASILAADDLCLAPLLAFFVRNKAAAIKIEGRGKSPAYAALVTDVYRTALSDLAAGRFRPRLYLDELSGLGNRPLGTGMFLPRRLVWRAPGRCGARQICGRIVSGDAGRFAVAVTSPWDADSPVRLVAPGLARPVLAASEYGLENALGERVTRAHPGLEVRLVCDHPLLAPGLFLQSETAEVQGREVKPGRTRGGGVDEEGVCE